MLNQRNQTADQAHFASTFITSEDKQFADDITKMFANGEGIINDYFSLPFDFTVNPLIDASILGKGIKGLQKRESKRQWYLMLIKY